MWILLGNLNYEDGLMTSTKPIEIPKQAVWKAYLHVKENRGAAGIDKESIEDFDKDYKKNLYKIWNRLSSGSYFPPPVKQVQIPKKDGKGMRNLSVPTIADRIAQTVIKFYLEPKLEPIFHADSYGYRPNKSAIEAVAVTKQRCWNYNWLVEFDIKKAFDSIDRELLLKAVRKHVSEKWIVMYIERWLSAPIITSNEELIIPTLGVPQGSVIGPVLMNLFMHYAFDYWMSTEHPNCPFARYADDGVVHCRTKCQAEKMLTKLAQRFNTCKLEIHPEKSKVVLCKDTKRFWSYENTQFTFLGFTFKPRHAVNGNAHFTGFMPAVSNSALKAMRQRIRASKLHRRTDLSIQDIAMWWNPIIKGWWNYYGSFYPSEMRQITHYFHKKIMQWIRRKYTNLKGRKKASRDWLLGVIRKMPNLLFSATLFGLPLAG
jgi:group II intron reverse transcriptase/maturase